MLCGAGARLGDTHARRCAAVPAGLRRARRGHAEPLESGRRSLAQSPRLPGIPGSAVSRALTSWCLWSAGRGPALLPERLTSDLSKAVPGYIRISRSANWPAPAKLRPRGSGEPRGCGGAAQAPWFPVTAPRRARPRQLARRGAAAARRRGRQPRAGRPLRRRGRRRHRARADRDAGAPAAVDPGENSVGGVISDPDEVPMGLGTAVFASGLYFLVSGWVQPGLRPQSLSLHILQHYGRQPLGFG
eukprot:gene10410-biopygen3298